MPLKQEIIEKLPAWIKADAKININNVENFMRREDLLDHYQNFLNDELISEEDKNAFANTAASFAVYAERWNKMSSSAITTGFIIPRKTGTKTSYGYQSGSNCDENIVEEKTDANELCKNIDSEEKDKKEILEDLKEFFKKAEEFDKKLELFAKAMEKALKEKYPEYRDKIELKDVRKWIKESIKDTKEFNYTFLEKVEERCVKHLAKNLAPRPEPALRKNKEIDESLTTMQQLHKSLQETSELIAEKVGRYIQAYGTNPFIRTISAKIKDKMHSMEPKQKTEEENEQKQGMESRMN